MNKLVGGAGVWALEYGGVQTRLPEKKIKIQKRKKIKKTKSENRKLKIAKKEKNAGNVLAICCVIPERAYFAL